MFLFFYVFPLKAEDVKLIDIKEIALNAFSEFSNRTHDELKIIQIIPFIQNDTTAFYVVNFDKGFIIIAADNISEPVLGFSLESQFNFNDLPPALLLLLEGYQQEILSAKKLNISASQEIIHKWNDYLNLNYEKGTSGSQGRGVAPQTLSTYILGTNLVETKWGQSGGVGNDNIPFNFYCPNGTLVGCGGVALAQILRFWRCNVHPQGVVNYYPPGFPLIYINLAAQTYCWTCMLPDKANYDNALFLYHCAAAIESEFGITGTTSYPYKVPGKLSQNFGFNGSIYYKSSYNDQNWIVLLKTDIDNRRPIFYSGQKTSGGGHGWVVDGYDSNNLFHCNWGWGGSSDGWYMLTNLTGNVGFTNNQSAVMNIYPTFYSGVTISNTTISSGTYTGHTISVSTCTIQNNANVIFKANCMTEIFGPFSVPVGATLEIK